MKASFRIHQAAVVVVVALLQIAGESMGLTAAPPPASPDHDVIIVGGGVTGLATAAALLVPETNDDDATDGNDSIRPAVRPSRICILEKSRCLRPAGATIGMFPNGVTALESISSQLADEVCSAGIPYRGVIRRDVNSGNVTKVGPSSPTFIGKGTYSVAWYILQQSLYGRIPRNVLHFGKVVESISTEDNSDEVDGDSFSTVTYRDRATNELERKTCRIVIGADGINSTVRDVLFPDYKSAFDDTHDPNRKLFRAIIPKAKLLEAMGKQGGDNDDDVIPPPGFTNTYVCRESDRLFAMRQLADDVYSFTSSVNGTFAFAQDLMGTSSDARLRRLRYCFRDFPRPVQHWIRAVDKNAIYENDVFDIDILEKWSRNNCLLIGDACHGMSPSLGQGANVGLEDAVELGALLRPILRQYCGENEKEANKNLSTTGASAKSIQAAFEKFERLRMERVGLIHEASRHRRNGNGLEPSFKSWVYSWRPSFVS